MTLDPNRTVNVAVQVLPLADDPYPIMERAIAVTPRPSIEFSWEGRGVIQARGVRHEVDAMETVTPPPSVNSS